MPVGRFLITTDERKCPGVAPGQKHSRYPHIFPCTFQDANPIALVYVINGLIIVCTSTDLKAPSPPWPSPRLEAPTLGEGEDE